MRLQIGQQRNLLFQLVGSHGDSRTSCLERQNTAECTEIPGKDGGASKKVLLRPDQHHTQQSPPATATYRGCVGQACGVTAVRGCLLGRITGADSLACLLATVILGNPIGLSYGGINTEYESVRLVCRPAIIVGSQC
jgi:hypothetical protein